MPNNKLDGFSFALLGEISCRLIDQLADHQESSIHRIDNRLTYIRIENTHGTNGKTVVDERIVKRLISKKSLHYHGLVIVGHYGYPLLFEKLQSQGSNLGL